MQNFKNTTMFWTVIIVAAGLSLTSVATGNSVTSAPIERPVNYSKKAPLASIDKTTGKLTYAPYANHKRDELVNILPDFSHAGYMGGGVALPSYSSIPIKVSLNAQDTGDDYARIKSAIDEIARLPKDARGIRGAVHLKAGRYRISQPIIIRHSGIIVRGDGQGKNGTIIEATSTEHKTVVISAEGEGKGRKTLPAPKDYRTSITQPLVPVGATSIKVASSRGYEVGDKIAIFKTPNEEWLGREGINTARFGWKPSRYEVSFDRIITAINDNTLFFDVPTVDTIEAQYGGGEIYKTDTSGRLQQVGIENLRIETQYSKNVKNEDRAFFGINYREIENSWIRDVTSRYISHGFNLMDGAVNITVQDVAYIDPNFRVEGGRLYPFNLDGGQLNLVQRCYGDKARHTLSSGSTVQGPNVFLDCLVQRSQSDDGPHHRWATGTLYDNANGQLLRFQNRETHGSGHGWAGAQQMVWNSVFEKIVIQAPPSAMNWSVGTIGNKGRASFKGHAEGMVQSRNKRVEPRSLYLQQLQDRLGPEAVAAVTTPEQQAGPIWATLAKRRGEGAK